MPPRRRTQARGASNPETPDAESDRAPSPVHRGRGRGRTRGRGRGRTARRAEEPAPAGAMPEVVAEIRGVHQAIETLVGMMADQRRVGGQPQQATATPVAPE